jgi:hypothetical protein
MLHGSEPLAQVKRLGDACRSKIVRATGNVSAEMHGASGPTSPRSGAP